MTIDVEEFQDRVEDVQGRVSDQAGKVGERFTSAVEGFRDRTADAVRADGGSVFRELHKLSRRIGEAESAVDERIEAAEHDVGRRIDAVEVNLEDRLDELMAARKRTTMPRRLFWLLVGAGIGVAVAYLADPDRGHARRAQLSDQAAARAREIADQAGETAKRTADAAKGNVIEAAKELTADDVSEDPRTLEARIKSEVFGHRDDVGDVVLRVDAPGTVTLKGTVDSSTTEVALLEQVATVDGVIDVHSELSVRSS